MSLYSFSIVTSGLEVHKNSYYCVTKEKWFSLVKLMAFGDTIITMIIPFFLILLSNVLIIVKLFRFSNPFKSNSSSDTEECSIQLSEIKISRMVNSYVSNIKQQSSKQSFKMNESSDSNDSDDSALFELIKKRNRYRSFDTINLSRKNSDDTINKRLLSKRNTISVINFRENTECRKVKKTVKYNLVEDDQDDRSLTNSNRYKKQSIITHILRKSVQLKRFKTYSKTTRMLLTVSSVFLLLNCPIAFSKIRYYYKDAISTDDFDFNSNFNIETSLNEEIIERLTCYIYYINFSFNFVIYSLNGAKFRSTLSTVLFNVLNRKRF